MGKEVIIVARVDQPIKIKPIAYNHFSEPDSSIVTGESFNCNQPFLIVASKPIPRSCKVYFEFTLTKQITSKNIRHLPIYVGLHKNPISGNLNTDCVFASVFYTLTEDFDIFEKERGSSVFHKQEVGKLHARIPIVNTVIGFSVDTFENKLTIYSDGKVFYEFHTDIFDIDDSAADESTGPWYFALYSNLAQSIAGKVNYGRYKTEYLPEGYSTLYQQYYYCEEQNTDVESSIDVDAIEVFPKMANFDGKIDAENPYATIDPLKKNRRPFLEHKVEYMDYQNNDLMFQMVAYRGSTAPDMTTVNFPCPAEDTPVYFELTIKDGQLAKNTDGGLKYIGVPVEVGLTVKKNDYLQKSFRLCLYHAKGASYMSYSVYDGNQLYYLFPEITNPAAPVQPSTVGFIIDRKNNLIKIITEGSVFVEVPIQGVDFSDWSEDAYIFVKSADQAYTDYLIGRVELGEFPISYDITEPGVKTFYDYWNDSIRFYLEDDAPEFRCRIKVKIPSYVVRHDMMSSLFVPYGKLTTNGFEPGLNWMWGTYNIVTDTAPENNLPAMDIFKYWAQMQEDLQLNSIKKVISEDIDDCKIEVVNDNYLYIPLLTGNITLTKATWYDIDCSMKVSTEPAVYKVERAYIHGSMNYSSTKYLDNLLYGFVAVDYINTAGYPKWKMVYYYAGNDFITDAWKKHPIEWTDTVDDTDYVRDFDTDPIVHVMIRPLPAIDYSNQKCHVEVFYYDTSLGSQPFDAADIANRAFLTQSYNIPHSLYNRNLEHKISISVTNDAGCVFKGNYLMVEIVIKASSSKNPDDIVIGGETIEIPDDDDDF